TGNDVARYRRYGYNKSVFRETCIYYAGFCTDGAPAMLGFRSGLAGLTKEKESILLFIVKHWLLKRCRDALLLR
ncbi:hypothetical protein ILUMI_11512, partial [Ignelater luminosus]